MKNVLFICSRNQWRSPTAEKIWQKHHQLNVRSAGTSSRARKTVRAEDIRWADVIFVMERKHKRQLNARFSQLMVHQSVYILDIPDNYQYMDPELIQILETSVYDYLGLS